VKFILQPWQLMLLGLAAWVNREQQARIEYLQTEVAVLKEQIGKKRILLTDDQRRRLAVKGKTIGRKALDEVGFLFTPDTILCCPIFPRTAPHRTKPPGFGQRANGSDGSTA
jgi:hypothetical protein